MLSSEKSRLPARCSVGSAGTYGLSFRRLDYDAPYKGSERNLTGNELGNLGEYGLFNVKADRTQYQNMAAQQPELLDSLKQNFFAEVDGYYRSEVEEEPLK